MGISDRKESHEGDIALKEEGWGGGHVNVTIPVLGDDKERFQIYFWSQRRRSRRGRLWE